MPDVGISGWPRSQRPVFSDGRRSFKVGTLSATTPKHVALPTAPTVHTSIWDTGLVSHFNKANQGDLPMKKNMQGFTLIELMIVVAIIALSLIHI